jgi:hypothetical protein
MKVWTSLVIVLAMLAAGCGGASSTSGSSSSSSSISGPWEVTMSSGQGEYTYLEMNLSQSASALSASSVLEIDTQGTTGWLPQDWCPAPPDTSFFAAIVSGNTISNGSFSSCLGNGLDTGTFSGTLINNNSIDGTATVAWDTSTVPFTAQPVTALSGTFTGTLNFPDGTNSNGTPNYTQNSATVTLTESSTYNLMVNGTVTGPNAGTISWTGSVIGNASQLSGTVSGLSTPVTVWYHQGVLYVMQSNLTIPMLYGQLTQS